MKKTILSILIVLVAGGVGFLFGQSNGTPLTHLNCSSDFKMINLNLDCDVYEQKTQNLSTLDDELNSQINKYVAYGKASRIGVFVRDLETQKFIGINDGETFNMASLLKVPLMIGGFKLAEVEPKILEQEIKYNGTPNSYGEQTIQPSKKLEIGKTYTIKDLIEHSITYSDNTAAQILFDYYPKGFMDRILTALGIQLRKREGDIENPVTARSYAGIFRTLFNASYLTREYSNEALTILSKVDYKDGSVAKLPKDVLVAHKFGERISMNAKIGNIPIKQLHDCGIVYLRNGKEPYTYCIMTEGTDLNNLQEVVQNLSLEIYNGMLAN